MERGFEVRTGSIAIGDPAMGLATLDLKLPPGHYCCVRGALQQPVNGASMTVTLDGPYVFVVDAALLDQFLVWFHRTFNACGFNIAKVAMRLNEAATELGAEVGFYWEETLSGRSHEGTYSVDPAKIRKVPVPGTTKSQ